MTIYIYLETEFEKIYNALLLNRIEREIEKILRKNQNVFRRNWSSISEIIIIRRITEVVRAKNLKATLLFVVFSKTFDFIHRGKMEQMLQASQRNCCGHNDVIQKYKIKSSLTVWRLGILWKCCWRNESEYISPVSVHNLPWLLTSNVNRSNERKLYDTKKRQ